MAYIFQQALSRSIKSHTIVSACRNIRGDVTQYVDSVGNHLSP